MRRSSADRRLLLRSLVLVSLVRLGLWVLPFRRLRRLVVVEQPDEAPPGARIGPPRRHSADEIARAVRSVSRRVPAASCLTQALAAQRLLAREGYDSELEIGVARNEAGTFEAHAWLVRDGRIIIGEIDGLTRYVPMRTAGRGLAGDAVGSTVSDAVPEAAREPVRDDT